MRRSLLALLAPILMSVGCSMCGSCRYDYLPPVADGPYCTPGHRAGSAFGGYVSSKGGHDGTLPDPAIASSDTDIIESADESVQR